MWGTGKYPVFTSTQAIYEDILKNPGVRRIYHYRGVITGSMIDGTNIVPILEEKEGNGPSNIYVQDSLGSRAFGILCGGPIIHGDKTLKVGQTVVIRGVNQVALLPVGRPIPKYLDRMLNFPGCAVYPDLE